MSKSDADEVLRFLDAIIKKLGCAIGEDFSSAGSNNLMQEVNELRKNIETIVNKNTNKEK